MSELAGFIEELKMIHDGDAWHGPALSELLSGVTHEQATSHPVAGAHSIWELVLHIAGWEDVFCRRIAGEHVVEPPEGDFPMSEDTGAEAWAAALAKLESSHDRLIKTVSALSDSRLDVSVYKRDYTVRFLLRGITRHHVYHSGQIGLLRKALATS